MDPSNRKFTNQNDEPSNPTDTRHDSPPQQLPNNFIPSQFPQSLNPQYFPNLYPFGGPASYPPYGHSPPTFQGLQHQGKWAPASFQGYHLQENLVSSPNQVFGAASTRGTIILPRLNCMHNANKQQEKMWNELLGFCKNVEPSYITQHVFGKGKNWLILCMLV